MLFIKILIKNLPKFALIFFLNGCDSKKTINGIEYPDDDVFQAVNESNFIENLSLIRTDLCQIKVIPPLSPIYQNSLNGILISKNKQIQAFYPDYHPTDEVAGDSAAEHIAEGGKLGATVVSALFAAGLQSYQNEKIFADSNIKKILLDTDHQIKNLYYQFTHSYSDTCMIKVVDFEDNGWDEHWGITKFVGAYKGKYKNINITLDLSNKLRINLELVQYDNGKFEYTIKSAQDIES